MSDVVNLAEEKRKREAAGTAEEPSLERLMKQRHEAAERRAAKSRRERNAAVKALYHLKPNRT